MGFEQSEVERKDIPGFITNAWIASRDMFKKYTDFVCDAMYLMESVPDLRACLQNDAMYMTNDMTPKRKVLVKTAFGTENCYHLHPFVLERLPCFFFRDKYVYNLIPGKDAMLSV
jgi:hypothetical protein